MAQPQVFRINYEAKGQKWDTYIVAHNKEEAFKFIVKIMGPFKIITTSTESRVDGITPEVLGDHKNVKEVEIKTEEYKCDKCDKFFKTEPALKAHVTRVHKKK